MVFAALLAFQLKHFVCDFCLQPYSMVVKKGIYLHPVGLLHAGIHVLGSVPAVLLLTKEPVPIAIALGAEFVVHYHSDWAKAQLDRAFQLDNRTTRYWIIFGADQLVHQLTYLAMTAGLYYSLVPA
jgi:hypothetical protein